MRLIWRDDALDDLDRIVMYIGRHNLDAGFRMQALIENYAERIAEHPHMGRPGRVPGTREAIVHPNYILTYRIGVGTVEILGVLHTRREYPPSEPE